jgi:hypothetical protein
MELLLVGITGFVLGIVAVFGAALLTAAYFSPERQAERDW